MPPIGSRRFFALKGGKTAVKPNGLHPGWVGYETSPEQREGAYL
jgi:hypothetical protein